MGQVWSCSLGLTGGWGLTLNLLGSSSGRQGRGLQPTTRWPCRTHLCFFPPTPLVLEVMISIFVDRALFIIDITVS